MFYLMQLQKLAELLDKPRDERGKESDCSKVVDKRPNSLLTGKSDPRVMSSDDEENQQPKYSDKETDLPCEPNMGSSLVPSEQQLFCFHQPSWPQDQSCATSQWWEFWPMNE